MNSSVTEPSGMENQLNDRPTLLIEWGGFPFMKDFLNTLCFNKNHHTFTSPQEKPLVQC